MRANWIYTEIATGEKVTITIVNDGNFGKRIHFVYEDGRKDFHYEKIFNEKFQIFSQHSFII